MNGLIMNGAIVASGNKSVENIQHRIYEVRGLQVMLDRDLAELYGVETRVLNQAVKRNIERFPSDFLFRLSKKEWDHLKSQIVISNNTLKNIDNEAVEQKDSDWKSHPVITGRGGDRALPYAFTELGVAMLSSVLRSDTAIQVNINIMRAFVMIRQAFSALQSTNLRVEQLSLSMKELSTRLEESLRNQNDINSEQERTNEEIAVQIEMINDVLDQLRTTPPPPAKPIGFKVSSSD